MWNEEQQKWLAEEHKPTKTQMREYYKSNRQNLKGKGVAKRNGVRTKRLDRVEDQRDL